ncbi:MAG: hypothetical protein ABL907_21835 [Hyphomicrobium sp.]
MESLFASGRIADLIVGLMLAEGVILTLVFRGSQNGLKPALIWSNLIAGAALVLALRSALTGNGWQWTALWLAAALVGHAIDLLVRWRS